MSDPLGWDAIVLAGGAGSRIGGGKPDVRLAGRRLLDHVLTATQDARRVVVVGDVDVPDGVLVTREHPPFGGPAAGVAAGLEALTRATTPAQPTPRHPTTPVEQAQPSATPQPSTSAEQAQQVETTHPTTPVERAERVETSPERASADWIAVLACDVPGASSIVPQLLDRAASASVEDDGFCVVDRGDHPQWFLALYRGTALSAAVAALDGAQGRSMKALVAPLRLRLVSIDETELTTDVDTWDDHARWTTHLVADQDTYHE